MNSYLFIIEKDFRKHFTLHQVCKTAAGMYEALLFVTIFIYMHVCVYFCVYV